MRLLPKFAPRSPEEQWAAIERALIRREAQIGASVFGPVPKGHNRQFFCLDENTWIWHEEWTENGKRRVVTTRYEVRPNGVLKLQSGRGYQELSRQEAQHLYQAVELYTKKVQAAYDQLLQAA